MTRLHLMVHRVGVLYALTSFVGAYLLFMVQPLMGKQVLPWYGGAPSIWSACLLFFQAGLVVGYGYAHLTRRLSLHRQMALHLSLLAVSLAVPVTLPEGLKPEAGAIPEASVLTSLAVAVGLPYVLLSATAPLLQDWFARGGAGLTAYRLYVASNLGSLGALISYPILVEPYLSVGFQAWGWRIGLGICLGLCAACGRSVLRAHPAESLSSRRDLRLAPSDPARNPRADSVLWVLLAGAGSALLLAVTNHLSQEVAAVPLIWVLPLALYLLTFIICFADWYHRGVWGVLWIAAVGLGAWALVPGTSAGLASQVAVGLILLMAGCMVCHGELVRLRPDPSQLTRFYLALAVGGAAGGAAVALVAPRIFTTYAELPLTTLLVVALLIGCFVRDRIELRESRQWALLMGLPLVLFFGVLAATLRSGGLGPQVLAAGRDFYGVVRVIEDAPGTGPAQRGMLHGGVLHGAQYVDSALRFRVDSYYGAGSGVDLALRRHPRREAGQPVRMGVIGLGVGSLAGSAQSQDTIRFFELSPIVIDFAGRFFTYLEDTRAAVDIVPGDGRLSLAREVSEQPPQHPYDVLVVDAFSGGSIPMHLLTRECFDVYEAALAPDGILAINATNKHVDIGPVVRALAEEKGWQVVEIRQEADLSEAIRENRWLLTGGTTRQLTDLASLGVPEDRDPRRVVWTDDFSSLVPVLRWR